MKKKKGFTLVELLAVIVILAVILVIAVPKIISTITESRKGALISSAKLIAASAESAYMSNQTLGIEKTITCSDVSKLSSEDYESCTIAFDSNGKAKVTIVGKGKFEGMSVCSATRETGEVSSECATDIACFAYEEIQQVSSFDINEEACKTYFVGQGAPTDLAETLCTGGEVGGSSLKGEIDAAIQDGSEEAISWISGLETEGVISNVQYSESVISITGYSETCPKDVIIPSKIDNKIVTTIEDSSFQSSQLTSVTIPNGVTTIGSGAFNNNKLKEEEAFIYERNSNGTSDNTNIVSYGGTLKDITIPNTVTTIGDFAFRSNQLTSVTIPNSVETIEYAAFEDNQLTSVTIPNSVTTIGSWAFADNQLTSVTIPNSVTTIESDTFWSNQLTSVTIPNSVTTIEHEAFANNKLTSVTIPNSVTTIGNWAFTNNQLTSVTIPNSVTTIGSGAFRSNRLTSVSIPNSVTTIGSGAFFKASFSNPNLTSIINTTGRSFDWSDIITGSSGTSSVTGTYNGVNVTTE